MAPDGKDSDPGTMEKPFATIARAQLAASAGDTVFIRGGKYEIKAEQIATPRGGNAVHVFDLNKSGTKEKPIQYFSYKDEKAIFDFATIKPAARVYAFYVTASWVHFKGFEITGIQVTETGHTQSECFENHGSNNVYEQLKMHDGMAIGYYALAGSNNLVINCDAWNNWDSVSEGGRGGNTDGFGCHVAAGGTGNIFRYCRSWYNSDDGYDCINCHESVLFDHCWAMYNGLNAAGKSLGDGNGFKAGGYGATAANRLPNPMPRNTVQFCLSVGNKASGFYANHHTGGANWFNNSAFRNGNNYNMLERLMDNRTDIPGPDALMRNNLGFGGNREVASLDMAKSDVASNYFTLDVKVTEKDFVSLDEKQLVAPRKADGSLPEITFMHLTSESKLIDRGVEIRDAGGKTRFSFNGTKPDLGCFETGPVPATNPGTPPEPAASQRSVETRPTTGN
ncbi:MAG TPA: DUF4990 domain-containing protein [Phycisphaerae bacterium]